MLNELSTAGSAGNVSKVETFTKAGHGSKWLKGSKGVIASVLTDSVLARSTLHIMTFMIVDTAGGKPLHAVQGVHAIPRVITNANVP